MKKIFCVLLSTCFVFGLTSCSGTGTGVNDLKGPIGVYSESTSSASSSLPSKSEAESAMSVSSEKSDAVTIEEAVILDESDVKITAKKMTEENMLGTSIKLLIENNSKKDLTIQTRQASVNGYMIETMMSTEVTAGKKANDDLTFLSDDLEACGISTIADMEFSFHIYDSKDWETYLDTDPIQIKTSAAAAFEYKYDDSGVQVYKDDYVNIVAKGLAEDDSIFGPGVVFYVENLSGEYISIQTQELSVNGFMIDSIFSEEISPNKRSICALAFSSSDLEENEITEIKDIELSFHVFQSDEWDAIVETEKITISF